MKKSIFLLLCFVSIFLTKSLHGDVFSINNAFWLKGEKIITDFNNELKKNNFEKMFSMMSGDGSSKRKDKFINLYKYYKQKNIKLQRFKIIKTSPEGSFLDIYTELIFSEELPPRFISGIHKFRLKIDEGKLKIFYIIPPLEPPCPGNIYRKLSPWDRNS